MIIVCEPQCAGIEHVEVNAAFLAALKSACPDCRIIFFAEEAHTELVGHCLSGQSVADIEHTAIEIPPRGLPNHQRFPMEYRLARSIFETADGVNADEIIFTSATNAGLVAVKLLLRKFPARRCAVMMHATLETVLKKRPPLKPLVLRSYLELPFWFRPAFLWGNGARLRYIVLGKSILEHLCRAFPKLQGTAFAIDLPYFYRPPEGYAPFKGGVVRFGSLGVASKGKGSDKFFKLADEIRSPPNARKAEFIQIGQVDRKLKYSGSSVKIPRKDSFLSREAYDGHAREIDYAVFFHKPESYRLTASGSLFDAFSHLKPVIALRSPFFAYYFNLMGDIGYLCDDYQEIKETVARLLEERPVERYLAQRENILKGREKIGVASIGRALKSFLRP